MGAKNTLHASNMHALSAKQIIAVLDLEPHPEGGHYRETFRDSTTDANGRPASTLIYFLLAKGERSAWHRIDVAEIWHYYAGAPLELHIAADRQPLETLTLGADIVSNQRPQGIVPPCAWQAAQSLGDWTLCGCTVAPGFQFEGFELAPAGWRPADGKPAS